MRKIILSIFFILNYISLVVAQQTIDKVHVALPLFWNDTAHVHFDGTKENFDATRNLYLLCNEHRTLLPLQIGEKTTFDRESYEKESHPLKPVKMPTHTFATTTFSKDCGGKVALQFEQDVSKSKVETIDSLQTRKLSKKIVRYLETQVGDKVTEGTGSKASIKLQNGDKIKIYRMTVFLANQQGIFMYLITEQKGILSVQRLF